MMEDAGTLEVGHSQLQDPASEFNDACMATKSELTLEPLTMIMIDAESYLEAVSHALEEG